MRLKLSSSNFGDASHLAKAVDPQVASQAMFVHSLKVRILLCWPSQGNRRAHRTAMHPTIARECCTRASPTRTTILGHCLSETNFCVGRALHGTSLGSSVFLQHGRETTLTQFGTNQGCLKLQAANQGSARCLRVQLQHESARGRHTESHSSTQAGPTHPSA